MISRLKNSARPQFSRLVIGRRTLSTENDRICELAASNLRFGPGSTGEVGADLKDVSSARRVVVFTDPVVNKLPCMQVLLDSLDQNGIENVVYEEVRVEPNDLSFQHAINFLSNTQYDAVVALGGGSVMDTAKAANLYATFPPSDFYDYVNPPVGKGLPVPGASEGALPPMIAIPTTAGTGSETTGVAIFDDVRSRSKTGIANRRLKPTLGIVDPDNTFTLPKEVACYSGLDVLCHAIESYTAMPFTKRAKPSSPILRPAYQGSNPISDVWSIFALETSAKHLASVAKDPENEEARAQMLLASSAAGMGFGNAGVHLCHGMSYPVASQVKSYSPANGYPLDHALVPHGLSVIVNAPAVFRFTGIADPERHKKCAQTLAAARGSTSSSRGVADSDAGVWLADEIMELAAILDVPMGLRNLGYTEEDVPSLVEGTLPQHRVTKISPRPVGPAELEALFLDALDE